MDYKGRVTLYSIVGCPHCIKAKSTLVDLGIKYVDVSVDEYEAEVREKLKEMTKLNTVPQIFFNEVFVGGNDALDKLVKDKEKLNDLINKVKTTEVPDSFMKLPSESLKKKDYRNDDSGFVCEPDEYTRLVRQMKIAKLVGTHSKIGIQYKNSFVGKDFVKWVMELKGLSEEESLDMGENLIQRHFGHTIRKGKGNKEDRLFQNNDTIYRLLEDDDTDALNSGSFSDCVPKTASVLSEDLRKMILKIYGQHLSKDGRKVDYEGIKQDPSFNKYVDMTKELQRLDIENSTREEKLAFFINIYNALVIHANVTKGVPTNIFQRWRFFNTVRYIIGGYSYSLQDIENGVLRGNRKGVAMLSKPFSAKDPRIKVALQEPEPLIHFALVCGAKSCPPIKTYSSDDIMNQLNVAAEAFLEAEDALFVNKEKNQIKMSQIFSWYQEDFGTSKLEVLKWIVIKMGDSEKKNIVKQMLENEKTLKIGYLTYDWSVNS